MAIDSPQAKVPSKLSTRSRINLLTTPGAGTGVLPPNIVIVNGPCLPRQDNTQFRSIQNCGTTAVKFLISHDPSVLCNEQNFHGVLSACTTQDDGFGGVVNFDKCLHAVSIYAVGGGNPRVCTLVGINAEFGV